MEARSVEEIPTYNGWQYEPKWDGFRCIAFRDDERVYLQSKNGQPLARYFPDVADAVAALPAKRFVLDGELVVPVSGALSFDELQLRLHPAASRVQKLAKAHPATYIVFDLLADRNRSYLKSPLHERRQLLEDFARSNFRSAKNIPLSPATTDLRIATQWFKKTGGDLDGIIAKRLDDAYASGERTAAVKVKQIRSADCVVGGFRYATGARVIGSLLLGLYGNDRLLHHVGFTSAFTREQRCELTKKFEALKKRQDSMATHLAARAVGAPNAPANGNRWPRRLSSKLPTIILPAAASGTGRKLFDGDPIKILSSARWIRSSIAKVNRSPFCDAKVRSHFSEERH